VVIGVGLILNPQVLVGNVHFGTTPTVTAFLISIPIGMVAYTGRANGMKLVRRG